MSKPDWKNWISGVRATFEKEGLRIGMVHAIYDNFVPQDFSFRPPDEMTHRTIEACSLLGCEEMVFHPVLCHDILDSIEKREARMDYNVAWFRQLAPTANRHAVHISIENLFDTRPQQPLPLLTDAESLLELLERIGDGSMGICLDTGHAHIMQYDIPEMIAQFGGKLRTLHLDDNFGPIQPIYPDLHQFPCSGTVDFPGVFRALKQTGYRGIINLEPTELTAHLPLPVRNALVTGGLQITKALATDAGF